MTDTQIHIRPERPDDTARICDLTQTAFAPTAHCDGDEGPAIDALRDAGDLSLSLVICENDIIIGQASFSPATIGDEPANGDESWVALGPISVLPTHQGKGYGRALIEHGLAQMRARGARGCVLIGDPKLYVRFGFVSSGHCTYANLDPAFVQYITFRGAEPKGEVYFAPALETHRDDF